jgi:hypothetical protein
MYYNLIKIRICQRFGENREKYSSDNNPDGISDFPYYLDCGATDYYPLTTVVVVPEPSPATLVMIAVVLVVAMVGRRRHE